MYLNRYSNNNHKYSFKTKHAFIEKHNTNQKLAGVQTKHKISNANGRAPSRESRQHRADLAVSNSQSRWRGNQNTWTAHLI